MKEASPATGADGAAEELRDGAVTGMLGLLRLSQAELDCIERGRDARLAQAMRALGQDPTEPLRAASGPELSEAAIRAVDGFVEGKESLEALRVLQLLDEPTSSIGSATERRARIGRVLEAVQGRMASTEARFRLSPPSVHEVRRRARVQLRDLVAVAAVLLVGTAILFPSMFSASSMAEEIRCAQNMQQAGFGFSLFAKDHDGRLPARDDRPEQPTQSMQWWRVGDVGSSHSANLFVLVRQEYVPLDALTCPGNHDASVKHSHPDHADWLRPEDVSYSYQLFNGRPPRFSDPGVKLLLADRSPVVAPAMRGEYADATLNSQNHGGRGQNLLLPDFSVYFVYSPQIRGGDNIWLPQNLEGNPQRVRLTGSEHPASTGDAFVGP